MASTLNHETFPVVIIGSGLSGLTAAIHLAERGIPPLIIESDNEWPGGRLTGGFPDTFTYQDRSWSFKSEHGAHALWGGYDNMRAMLARFLKITLRESEGEEWINRWRNDVRRIEAGKTVQRSWLPAPFHYLQLLLKPRFWSTITPLDFLSLPGFLVSIFLTLGLDPIKDGIALNDLFMKEYFRGWTPNLRATFTGLGRNLLAAPSEQITLGGFIAALRFYTMLRRDSWRLQYLPGNAHDCLIQPLIDQIKNRGGMIMMGTRALTLKRENFGWRIRVENSRRGGISSLDAEHVILAIDAPAAEHLLCNSTDTAELAANIRFPSALRNATARLWFSASPRFGSSSGMFTGDFAVDNFFWLHRLHDEFFEWHECSGGSVVEVHFYAKDDVLEQSDAVLTILATSEIQKAFPELRGHFVYGVIRRNGITQTQFIVPTKNSLGTKTPWPGILACGDWISHSSPAMWMERCCITGIEVANYIIEANLMEPFPIIPPREPEWLAGVLERILRATRHQIGPLFTTIIKTHRRLFHSS